jgi:hypothetical protein
MLPPTARAMTEIRNLVTEFARAMTEIRNLVTEFAEINKKIKSFAGKAFWERDQVIFTT